MYGFSDEQWQYIVENKDFHEAYKPNAEGHEKVKYRTKFFESEGRDVIPYEDEGVSVGIYIMRGDKFPELSLKGEANDKQIPNSNTL